MSLLSLGDGLDCASSNQTACEGQCGEVVLAAQVLEPNYAVDGDAIDEGDDGGDDLNLQLLDEEGRLLDI